MQRYNRNNSVIDLIWPLITQIFRPSSDTRINEIESIISPVWNCSEFKATNLNSNSTEPV